jgi:hypothetical protein
MMMKGRVVPMSDGPPSVIIRVDSDVLYSLWNECFDAVDATLIAIRKIRKLSYGEGQASREFEIPEYLKLVQGGKR